jgi:hypothetical protein
MDSNRPKLVAVTAPAAQAVSSREREPSQNVARVPSKRGSITMSKSTACLSGKPWILAKGQIRIKKMMPLRNLLYFCLFIDLNGKISHKIPK